ncbi:ATP-dependent zinc protease [Candidatus Woesearchaeota archaeon]|nr:ATP-dependent zinc protease [Candidatus Woesearchaeota archaeon]
MQERTIVGLVERVTLQTPTITKEVIARIDTGATKSSIDTTLATELHLGPILQTRIIKSASGKSTRPILEATLTIAGKKLTAEFTVADRSHMKYTVLIGQNILSKGFLIDPDKKGE